MVVDGLCLERTLMSQLKLIKNTKNVRLFKCVDFIVVNNDTGVINLIKSFEFHLLQINESMLSTRCVLKTSFKIQEYQYDILCQSVYDVFNFSKEICHANKLSYFSYNYETDLDSLFYFDSTEQMFYETDPYYQFAKNGRVFDI